MAKTTEIKYEVVEEIGDISARGNATLKLRLISWNDNEPKYDLRTWYTDDKGVEKCNKGITLSKEELITLASIVEHLDD